MRFKIQEEENYSLAIVNGGRVDSQLVNDIKDQFNSQNSYFIIDLEFISDFRDEFMESLSEWNNDLKEQQILLVAAALDGNHIELFEGYGILGIPSVDEAVDFIFMDQLEKELGEELD